MDGDQHARSGNEAGRCRIAQTDILEIAAAHVAGGSDPGRESLLQVFRRAQRLFGNGFLQVVEFILPVIGVVHHRKMGVGVDETRRESGITQIDDLRSGRSGRSGADSQDSRARHNHQAGRAHLAAVKHARGLEYDGFLLAEAGRTQ